MAIANSFVVTHHNSAQVAGHTLAVAGASIQVGVFMGWLQPISLILSTAAATASLITMAVGGFKAMSERRATIRAAEIQARATLEAEALKAKAVMDANVVAAQAKIVAKAIEVSSHANGKPEALMDGRPRA